MSWLLEELFFAFTDKRSGYQGKQAHGSVHLLMVPRISLYGLPHYAAIFTEQIRM